MKKDSLAQKLKKRWGVSGTWDVILILGVFACTGSSTGWVVGKIKANLDITFDTDPLLTISIWILGLFIYQPLLLLFGFIFGQHRFFWRFQQRMWGRIFKKKSEEEK